MALPWRKGVERMSIPYAWLIRTEDDLEKELNEQEYNAIVNLESNERREITLLRAARDLLKKQDESSIVLHLISETAVWDGVECDGAASHAAGLEVLSMRLLRKSPPDFCWPHIALWFFP